MEDLKIRENILKEALDNNEINKLKWKSCIDYNLEASKNMEFYEKNLKVEVLVPIGNKAFMPGYLYHTNEVLTGHFQGIFTKCSVSQAQEIIKQRVQKAKNSLEELEREKKLFENKLNIPHADGALPNEEQQEIIEEYNEEKEKLWREEHKKRVKEYKQKERQERQDSITKDAVEDTTKILEELEIIEELNEELENLEVDDSETFEKLMSGEIKLPPEKLRISHCNEKTSNLNKNLNDIKSNSNCKSSASKNDSTEINFTQELCNKCNEEEIKTDYTNNNHIPNTEDFDENALNYRFIDFNDDSEKNICKIEETIKDLPIDTKIKYLKGKIREIIEFSRYMKEIKELNVMKKLHLNEIKDYFKDQIEIINHFEKETIKLNDNVNKKTKKINFALEDQIQLIDKNEKVEDMMKTKKDIIVLDPEVNLHNSEHYNLLQNITENSDNKVDNIFKAVQENYNYIIENQNREDFDLVNKIINLSNKKPVKEINFIHSAKVFEYSDYKENEKIIGNPAEIYDFYCTKLKESNTVDSRNEILNDKKKSECTEKKLKKENEYEENKLIRQNYLKPSLKNKDAVKQEIHWSETKDQQKSGKNNLPCYVLGDVVENSSNEKVKPDPLPNQKFIDTHAPKKRISRFKQARNKM